MMSQTGSESSYADPALLIGFVAALVLFGFGVWRFIQWMVKGPSRPDPWDEDVAAEVAKDETPALCHRCLAPHHSLADFCPECGAPVGTYTNWLPYPYLFSIGYTLRVGTSGDFKRSPLSILGFFLLSLVEYSIFAPIYWFMFLKSLFRRDRDHAQLTSQPQLPPSSS